MLTASIFNYTFFISSIFDFNIVEVQSRVKAYSDIYLTTSITDMIAYIIKEFVRDVRVATYDHF